MADSERSRTPFHDLSTFVAVPRLNSLTTSPDGSRLVAGIQELNAEGNAYVSALWELDPAGEAEAIRLTRSEKGESAPAFRPDGTLFFLSGRPAVDPGKDAASSDEDGAAIWQLPARGEASRLLHHPGGIGEFTVSRDTGRLAWTGELLPGTSDAEAHGKLRKARKDAKVAAILHEQGPVRFWDHDLGPGEEHVFVSPEADSEDAAAPLDLGGRGPRGSGLALSPDGTRTARVIDAIRPVPDETRAVLVVSDTSDGRPLHTLQDPRYSYGAPVFSSDGSALIYVRERESTHQAPQHDELFRLDLATGEQHNLLPGFDNRPYDPVTSPNPADAGTVWFSADVQGHCPIFRLDADGTVTRLTATGSYSSVSVSPDGRTAYALRAAVDSPATAVRLDAAAAEQQPAVLRAPGAVTAAQLPGSLTEVTAEGDDGFPLRAYLALPEGASADNPAPLIVVPHGGPEMSWNSWTWRWSPWPMTARGYAVLLPDPALSTGYGQKMHERGWGQWGGRPYRDVMALTDAALERPDLDSGRTALAGASYGGYMANWVATRTDRFRAIVSHAGLWDLRSFSGNTDAAAYFERIFGDPVQPGGRYEANSPNLGGARISTPMLVVHGARDYRVPVGEGIALWHTLQRFEVPAKFLYFPDENHWILKPNNARVWYSAVLNFLDQHVLGADWERPELL